MDCILVMGRCALYFKYFYWALYLFNKRRRRKSFGSIDGHIGVNPDFHLSIHVLCFTMALLEKYKMDVV